MTQPECKTCGEPIPEHVQVPEHWKCQKCGAMATFSAEEEADKRRKQVATGDFMEHDGKSTPH